MLIRKSAKNNHATLHNISQNTDTPITDSGLKRFFVIQTLICRYFIYLTKMIITEDMQVIKRTNH